MKPGDRVRHRNPFIILHACHGTVVKDDAPALFDIPGTVLVTWDEERASISVETGSSRTPKKDARVQRDRYPISVLEKIPVDDRCVAIVSAVPISPEGVGKALAIAEITAREIVAIPAMPCNEGAKDWALRMRVPVVEKDGTASAVDYLSSPSGAWKGAIVAITDGSKSPFAFQVMAAAKKKRVELRYVKL